MHIYEYILMFICMVIFLNRLNLYLLYMILLCPLGTVDLASNFVYIFIYSSAALYIAV